MNVNHLDTRDATFQGMLGASPAMLRVFAQLERAARSEVSVLLRGESGTGKELAAKALHALGGRSRRPFQAINCATLTSEMLASRLFGHVKGAFTGAVSERKGLLELADTGTLFLDEVADIPLDLQGRLLRVLQDHTYTPVGGARERRTDIRVIAATNASLRERVDRRLFREDLMYRLRVVILRLPPLRERGSDLELLTQAMIRRFNRIESRTVERIAPGAWDAMRRYAWPGNVRELQNVLQAAFVLGEGSELTLDELSPELRGEGYATQRPQEASEEPTLAQRERDKLLRAWDRHGGRRGAMAAALGISRSTLYRKLREHQLI